MNWEKHKLGSLVKVISGFAFKSRDFKSNGDIPVIKIKDIQKERVVISEEYFLDKSFLQIDKKFHCQKGDILISLTGSHITLPNSVVGRIAKYQYDKTSLLNQRAGKIIVLKENVLDNDFLYYYLCQEEIRTELALFGRGGANQVNISPKNVESIDVTIPPIEIQKRIADILSNYDDLIENNLKRINLIEQAAQNIYKEWFVNMRFPGYESAEIDLETGLPEGWKKETVKDYVKIASKGPSLNYNTDSGIPVLNQSCVRNKEIELEKIRYAEELKENKSHCYLQINDILINSMGQGTLGRVSKNNSIKDRFIIHNCLTFLRAKDIYSQAYLFHFISSKEDYFISIAQGSTGQTTLKLELVTCLEITIPSTRLLKAFDKIVLDFWSQIGNLKQQNKKLKQARDILLPRLMNQTIEV